MKKIPDGRAQRRVRETLDPKQNWSLFIESVSSALASARAKFGSALL